MVWSVAIPAAIAIGSAAYQWYNSQQAQNASKEERDRIAGLINKVQSPEFDWSEFTPEDYKVVEHYFPEQVPYVEAAAPELANVMSSEGKSARSAQMEALRKYQELADSGQDPLAEIERDRSARRASANAASNRATVDSAMERRGLGVGSGLGYASQLQGTSDAFQADALAGEQAAASSIQRRDQALGQSAQLGDQIFGQESDLAKTNASILNQFNQWGTTNKQNYLNETANRNNEATRFNINNAQGVANMNVGGRNAAQTAMRNQKQTNFNNEMDKIGLQQGVMRNNIQGIQDQAGLTNRGVQGLSQGVAAGVDRYSSYLDKEDERDRRDLMVRS